MKDFPSRTIGPGACLGLFAASFANVEEWLRIIALLVGIASGIASIIYHMRKSKE